MCRAPQSVSAAGRAQGSSTGIVGNLIYDARGAADHKL